ncbi:hypothetical protein [Rubellicoccus peritrichatus]|uniref:Uncharacterized protein n=1 Tax=Rubellicoccus peritrichatus TaxID=3080537 RepID=A0AAQ3L8P1_9BACT|nr:hypothetical protein [Puniceicoccus sp. CR14]WOO41699.1 hypothetical protein RZN69_01265 [Puniceicoccus sp. CR14]
MKHFIPILILTACLISHAHGSIESLEQQLSEYQIPVDKGGEVIPSLRIIDGSLNNLIELVEARGITVSAEEGVKDRGLSITLRNLSLNRILGYCTEAAGADWVYSHDMVVIYSDISSLHGSFKRDAKEKRELEAELLQLKLKVEKRKEHKGPLSDLIVTGLSADKVSMKTFVSELSSRSVASDPEGKGINIIFLGSEGKTDLVSYNSGDMELSKILDRVCRRYDYEWEYRKNTILVQKSNR